MKNAFEIAVGIFELLIAYVYPFIAVFHGRSKSDVIGKSWGLQIVYFIGLCFGVPALGAHFGREVRNQLVDWVPEPRILVPVLFFGWMAPWLAGSLAILIRRRLDPDHSDHHN